jgi:hypothetical protein
MMDKFINQSQLARAAAFACSDFLGHKIVIMLANKTPMSIGGPYCLGLNSKRLPRIENTRAVLEISERWKKVAGANSRAADEPFGPRR